jgi:hypothetical protein
MIPLDAKGPFKYSVKWLQFCEYGITETSI